MICGAAFGEESGARRSNETWWVTELRESWDHKRADAGQRLASGDFEAAERIATKLLAEMVTSVERGPGDRVLFGSVVQIRALAFAGMGKEREALWDRFVAAALDPTLESADLSLHGAAGQRLREMMNEVERLNSVGLNPGLPEDAQVVPPEKKSSRSPKYPRAKARACIEGPIVVAAIVDRDGLPKYPSVESGEDASLIFVALDAMREWRFSPATFRGEPVAVRYTLTVNYGLRHC